MFLFGKWIGSLRQKDEIAQQFFYQTSSYTKTKPSLKILGNLTYLKIQIHIN